MTMPDLWTLPSAPTIDLLGWTLLHFVWQGALLAALLMGALYLLRTHAPRVRYAVSCVALLSLLALPVGTGLFLNGSGLAAGGGAAPAVVESAIEESALPDPTVEATAPASLSWQERAVARVQPAPPWLVLGWGVGVLLFATRLAGGAWHVRRLCRTSTPASAEWQERLRALAEQMGLRRSVALHRSERVESPVVAGWWRPVVLVPAGLLSGLPPRQVEALLLHELAHVRRHDVLVGRLQAIVETLLFFHPATWWVSRQVREAREACCDDLAVRAGTDRTVYARALTALAERAVAGPAVAWTPAAGDGSLLARVRRLLSPGETASAHTQRLSLAAARSTARAGPPPPRAGRAAGRAGRGDGGPRAARPALPRLWTRRIAARLTPVTGTGSTLRSGIVLRLSLFCPGAARTRWTPPRRLPGASRRCSRGR